MSETEDYGDGEGVALHGTTHQQGGTDEINIDGLHGVLTDPQTPGVHHPSHENVGADEISVEGLSGQLAENQPSTWALVSGKPTTFAPEAHKTNHQDGGSDKIDLKGLVAPILRDYIFALELVQNGVDPDHDIDIQAGAAADSTHAYDLVLTSNLTKKLDQAWTEGTNQGGLDTGNIAASTWYHVYLIRKDSDGTIDALFTTTYGNPTMPAGWTAKRRIGSVGTGSLTTILDFTQFIDCFYWYAPVLDVDDADLDVGGENYVLANIPTGLRVIAFLNVASFLSGTAALVYIRNPDFVNSSPSDTQAPLATIKQAATLIREHAQIEVLTDASAQIHATPGSNNTTFKVATLGWRDPRV